MHSNMYLSAEECGEFDRLGGPFVGLWSVLHPVVILGVLGPKPVRSPKPRYPMDQLPLKTTEV